MAARICGLSAMTAVILALFSGDPLPARAAMVVLIFCAVATGFAAGTKAQRK